MTTKKIKMIHYTLIASLLIAIIIYGILIPKTNWEYNFFCFLCIMLTLVHSLIYLIMSAVKEVYGGFKIPKYANSCMVVIAVAGSLVVYCAFHITEAKYFMQFCWLYYILLVLSIIGPMIVFYFLDKKKKPQPKIIQNKR